MTYKVLEYLSVCYKNKCYVPISLFTNNDSEIESQYSENCIPNSINCIAMSTIYLI